MMEISVNDTVVESKIKFSLNDKTLERILERYPTVVSMVFNPKAFCLTFLSFLGLKIILI